MLTILLCTLSPSWSDVSLHQAPYAYAQEVLFSFL